MHAESMRYALNHYHWQSLSRFLYDGCLELDTNRAIVLSVFEHRRRTSQRILDKGCSIFRATNPAYWGSKVPQGETN